MSALIERLEAMLASGEESALLRFSLGNAYIESQPEIAITHFKRAVEIDQQYSAAWKLLGKAQTGAGDSSGAIETYRRGIDVAEARGDKQAAREMGVFLKRLTKTQS